MQRFLHILVLPRIPYVLILAVWCAFFSLPLFVLAAIFTRGAPSALGALFVLPFGMVHNHLDSVRQSSGEGWPSLLSCLGLLGVVSGGFVFAKRWRIRWLGYTAWIVYLAWALIDCFTNLGSLS